MVYTAAQLIRRQGVAATGLREVVAAADAPRGSLQHYFPEGKDQLVGEAVVWAGDYAGRRVGKALAGMRNPTPARLFAAMAEQWRAEFRTSGYGAGCPLVASAADVAGWNEGLRAAVSEALRRWQQPVVDALKGMGVPARRAPSLASVMISALEGAIVQARVLRRVSPIDAVVRELGPLLDGAVVTPRGGSGTAG
jgi:AcrR family transcriptional regulator